VAPAGSGAIGAACEAPETATKTKPATAIAKAVRTIDFLLRRISQPTPLYVKLHDSSTSSDNLLYLNKQSEFQPRPNGAFVLQQPILIRSDSAMSAASNHAQAWA
jgi:hypothetical protein